MSLLYYIDNEVPLYGEWDAVATFGSSTILRSALGKFPERGDYGLRTTIVGTDAAYVQKDVGSISASQTFCVGFWCRVPTHNSNLTTICQFMSGGANLVNLYVWDSSGDLQTYFYNDALGTHKSGLLANALPANKWTYLVLEVKWASSSVASDAELRLYSNGRLLYEITGVDRYDMGLGSTFKLKLGIVGNARNGYIIDHDEIKIGTTLADVEPYHPEPETDYVEPARTLVLYRPASADSVTFAYYCVEHLDIPLANLVPLPNATATETLADYATFQSEIENDLASWLAANPTADANRMCFIVGYNVPGYFYNVTETISATSRLMNYGNTFTSGGKANPLYLGGTGVSPERITKAALDAAGVTLAVRIDCTSLSNVQNILNAGLAVSAMDKLADSDIFYSDDADYLDSLVCQKLRLQTSSNLSSIENAAFFHGIDIDTLPTTGSRVVFAETGWSSADSLREWSNDVYFALKYRGWAAGIGWAFHQDTFDAGSFFEMLRIGGTFAEAEAVAVAKVDYTAVAVGEPLMTVSLPKQGCNIYKGVGGIESVDWSSPVACLRHDQNQATLKTTLASGHRHVYAARAVSTAGIEEKGTLAATFIEVDEQGAAMPPPLSAPLELSAAAQTDGSLLVSFSYETGAGESEPESFELLSDFGTGEINPDNPVAVLSDISADQMEFEISVPSPTLPAIFAVRAVCDGQIGPLGEIVYVQPLPSPQPPTTL